MIRSVKLYSRVIKYTENFLLHRMNFSRFSLSINYVKLKYNSQLNRTHVIFIYRIKIKKIHSDQTNVMFIRNK